MDEGDHLRLPWDDLRFNYFRGKDRETAARELVAWAKPQGIKVEFDLFFPRMASDRIYREILKRAAEVAGGEDKLAQHLDVRSEDMHEWVQGRATAPAGIY